MYDYFLEHDFLNRWGWNGGVPRNFRSRFWHQLSSEKRWCPQWNRGLLVMGFHADCRLNMEYV